MSRMTRDDLIAGGIFIAFGVAFGVTASTYETGSLLRMGAGYFPMVLGILLAALGAAIVGGGLVAARRRPAREEPPTQQEGGVPWGRGVLVLLAIVYFGFAVAPLGLVPALLVATVLSALAGHGTRPGGAAVIAVGLTLMCVLVFVGLLRLELPLVAGTGW